MARLGKYTQQKLRQSAKVVPSVQAKLRPRKNNMEEEIDRWFDFVEEYYKESTVPLSFSMLPDTPMSFRQPGSFSGFYKGARRDWNKMVQ